MDDASNAAEATVEQALEARTRNLGEGFTVRRVLPQVARRMVGPFIFVDHMGPVKLGAGHGLDVRPHPHINLATVTYLFDGEIVHRDSIGCEQVITPGAVNWMTAGKGIVHSERSPTETRKAGASLFGLQLWVALPKIHEEIAPTFEHQPASAIPSISVAGHEVRVIAGSAYGVHAPVKVLSPLFYCETDLARGAVLPLPDEHAARAAYVVSGAIQCDGVAHGEASLVIFKAGANAALQALEDSRVMLLGGAPLDGERYIFWNFVSSDKQRIETAKADWQARRFPSVPGDDSEFIPLPT